MQQIIEAEQESDGLDSHRRRRQRKATKVTKRKREIISDPEDEPFSLSTASASLDSETEGDSSVAEIMPDEVSSDPHCSHIH